MNDTTRVPIDRPVYGFYGDDFTGATDTLAHLARAGLRTMLFFEPPSAIRLATLGALDAIGVAGAARTMTPEAQQAELSTVGAAFAALGVNVMHYKVCSTFDSAPDVGSVGVAVRVLREHFTNPLVAIVGGQPNLRRYCAFGHLFAAASADSDAAAVYRIDRHPTMSRHPVTPMNESDLRLHLYRQGLTNVVSIDLRWYAQGDASLNEEVERRLKEKPDALLFDVLEDRHVRMIGQVIERHVQQNGALLAVGASSVAQTFAMAHGSTGHHANAAIVAKKQRPAGDSVFVLAGSLSPLTQAQIDAAHSYHRVEIDSHRMTDDNSADYLASQVASIASQLRDGKNVLAYTTRRAIQASSQSIDGQRLAKACAGLLQRIASTVPLRRIGIAGGDTSSFAVRALGAWGLSYLAPLSNGVTVCRLHADRAELDGVEIMLKGGQMGDVDLFEQWADSDQFESPRHC